MKRLMWVATLAVMSLMPALSLVFGASVVLLQAQEIHNTDYLGGSTTIYNTTGKTFSFLALGILREQRLLFFVRNSFFNQNWVTAPVSNFG